MDWMTKVMLYMGIFALMVGGLVAALIILMGCDAQKIWDRIVPALGVVVGSNVAAAIVLSATRWFVGSHAIVALAAMLTIASTGPAMAQVIDVGLLVDSVLPYVLTVLVAAIAVFVGWLAKLLKDKWNLDIDASHRDALQTALVNAAGLLVARAGGAAKGRTITVNNPLIADAVNYVGKAVPDAMTRFGLTPEEVAEKIFAKIPAMAPDAKLEVPGDMPDQPQG